jgi:hypothetical protein
VFEAVKGRFEFRQCLQTFGPESFCLPVWYPKISRLKCINVILPFVLCGRDFYCFTLREEHRLRDWDSGVQRDNGTGDLKSLLNGELYDSYC